jgi:hypothetical protein
MAEKWGDIARVEVNKRGFLFFADVKKEIQARLTHTSNFSVFGAACAERLLTQHLQLPASEIHLFTAEWRTPLDNLWEVMATHGDSEVKREAISAALSRHYAESFEPTEENEDDADEDAAAACICACESVIKLSPDSAFHSASRLIDFCFSILNEAQDQGVARCINVAEFIADCCHPFIQQELRWMLDLLSTIEQSPLNPEFVERIRRQAMERPFRACASSASIS